jgi:glycosyltransferase involved in cell wall biosynthesis
MGQLVSVLIPVHNVAAYVERALKSMLAQTYTNIEIIVVDDGSSDETAAIVSAIAARDDRVVLLRNECNSKIVFSLNRAFSVAKGTYIARMDGDDISAPDRIERLVAHLEANPEDALVGCSVVSIDADDRELGRSRYPASAAVIFGTLEYRSPVAHIWVARRSLYERLNGYREMAGVEDYDFLLRAISAGCKVTNVEDYYGYMVRIGRAGNSASSLGLKQRKMHAYAYKLYQRRKTGKEDGFTLERFARAIASSSFETAVYRLSSRSLNAAIRHKARAEYLRMIVCLFGAFVSPAQAKYLYGRMRIRACSRA